MRGRVPTESREHGRQGSGRGAAFGNEGKDVGGRKEFWIERCSCQCGRRSTAACGAPEGPSRTVVSLIALAVLLPLKVERVVMVMVSGGVYEEGCPRGVAVEGELLLLLLPDTAVDDR